MSYQNNLGVLMVAGVLVAASLPAPAIAQGHQGVSSYDALSHPPRRDAGHDVNFSIYRLPGRPVYGKFAYRAPVKGLVLVDPPHGTETRWTRDFEIAWTKMGNKGPLVLFLQGVPTNRRQWEDIQSHVSRFAETIAIDMLGMGESTKPRMYGGENAASPNPQWFWQNDLEYIDQLMQHYYPDRQFIFVADDWGSGIAKLINAVSC